MELNQKREDIDYTLRQGSKLVLVEPLRSIQNINFV